MGTTMTTADVAERVIHITIETIQRKTTEGYAVFAVRGIIRKLQPTHPCLRYFKVQSTRFLEFGSSVTVDPELNSIHPLEVGHALQDILVQILGTMQKSAGYFLIKEIKDRLNEDSLDVLQSMGVDLNAIQITQEIKSKEPDFLAILPSDVIRRLLKTILHILETQTSRTYAFQTMIAMLREARTQYPFLETVSINDIRITLGSDEVIVDDSINFIDSRRLRAAFERIILDSRTAAGDQSGAFLKALRTQLTSDYLLKLQTYGVSLSAPASDMTEVLRQVIQKILEVLAKATSEEFAVHALNTFLHMPEERITLLKSITIQTQQEPDGTKKSILANIPEVSESEARRAIQRLLETIVQTLGEKVGSTFIDDFRDALDKTTLARIEQMGVNLHIIALHQSMREHLSV